MSPVLPTSVASIITCFTKTAKNDHRLALLFPHWCEPSILATTTTKKRQLIIIVYTRLHYVYNL